jgi:ComF family protein
MKQLFNRCRTAWQWFLSALFPSFCLVCGREGSLLCETHRHTLPPAPANKAVFSSLDDIYAGTAYTHPHAETIIQQYKYSGDQDIAHLIAQILCERIPESFKKPQHLWVPIPLHWTRRFQRGFNQSERLIQELKNLITIETAPNLKRIRKTKQQAKLAKKERIQNLHNCFVWTGESLKGKNIILVDDVVATGTTLDEAAKALKSAGAISVKAVVFARGGK